MTVRPLHFLTSRKKCGYTRANPTAILAEELALIQTSRHPWYPLQLRRMNEKRDPKPPTNITKQMRLRETTVVVEYQASEMYIVWSPVTA